MSKIIKEKIVNESKRSIELDLIRGFAVFFMLYAHIENAFHRGNFSVLSILERTATTLAFPLFIIVSGVGTYFSIIKKELSFFQSLKKLLKRASLIYLFYLFLYLVTYIASHDVNLANANVFIKHALFLKPIEYTEYLVPLILLPFLALFFKFKKTAKLFDIKYFVVSLIIILYVSAHTLSISLDKSGSFGYVLKALFGGDGEYYFPLVQYSATFLFGMFIAKYISSIDESWLVRKYMMFGIILLMTIFVLLSFNTQIFSGFIQRWPPNALYLLIAPIFMMIMLLIYNKTRKLEIWQDIARVGKRPMQIYISHIILLIFYINSVNVKYFVIQDLIIVSTLFFLSNFSLAYVLTRIKDRLGERKHKKLVTNLFIFVISVSGLLFMASSQAREIESPSTDNSQIVDVTPTVVATPQIIKVTKDKNWVLISSKLPEEYSEVLISIKPAIKTGLRSIPIEFSCEKTNTKFTEQAFLEDSGEFEFLLNANNFKACAYKFEVLGVSDTINVAYPIFVNWTVDYEGYMVSKTNLDAIAKISDDNGLPITHMFNPRIYMAPEISESNVKFLTNWVLNRHETKNEEIEMHIHMQFDMIKEIGLEPKTEPRWSNRANGSDILTSAYNYEEFTQIIKWARERFEENGLPYSNIYRAGGWFIEEEQLKVLQDQGFSIDSSGRNSYYRGTQKGPWTLNELTQPYRISASDQNKSKAPYLDLWEMPNNAYDSTNDSYEKMKSAFDKNYNEYPFKRAQVVTFLSHPDSFAKNDFKKMESLVNYINEFAFNKDKGPVIYLTLQESFNYWE